MNGCAATTSTGASAEISTGKSATAAIAAATIQRCLELSRGRRRTGLLAVSASQAWAAVSGQARQAGHLRAVERLIAHEQQRGEGGSLPIGQRAATPRCGKGTPPAPRRPARPSRGAPRRGRARPPREGADHGGVAVHHRHAGGGVDTPAAAGEAAASARTAGRSRSARASRWRGSRAARERWASGAPAASHIRSVVSGETAVRGSCPTSARMFTPRS